MLLWLTEWDWTRVRPSFTSPQNVCVLHLLCFYLGTNRGETRDTCQAKLAGELLGADWSDEIYYTWLMRLLWVLQMHMLLRCKVPTLLGCANRKESSWCVRATEEIPDQVLPSNMIGCQQRIGAVVLILGYIVSAFGLPGNCMCVVWRVLNKRKRFICGQKPPCRHMTHGGKRRSMLRQRMSSMTEFPVEMSFFCFVSIISSCF